MIEPFTDEQAQAHFRGLYDTAFINHERGKESGTALLEVLDALGDAWGGAACSFRRFELIDPGTRRILYRLMEARAAGVRFGTWADFPHP